ncbi:MAG TPA: glycosyl hydrolase family 28-related protein, partial [Armatimonadota bacterium]|nr:glycosyl hydrolase family 28-related protein [Armatimonadota bacterium]
MRFSLVFAAGLLFQAVAVGQSASMAGSPLVISVKDFGAEGDWDWGNQTGADDTAAFQKAIDYAASPASESAVVYFPAGSYRISSTIYLPNWVRVTGDNGRNSQIHADPDFADACMFHAKNGEQSMFNSRLENLWIRVHDNARIEAVIRADAWQENCGMSGVVITGFTKYGIELQFGYGGAATLHVE